MAKNTWAKWVHIAWHEELLAMQKKQAMQAQQQQQNPPPEQPQNEGKKSDKGGGGGKEPKVGKDQKDGQKVVAPLAQQQNPLNMLNK